ncbi:uncharacterized protein N7459_004672 [Penicillium hispanicum]|uniref:uncharacterized protein n=1 Tax=Penicillium hispanicum TaxID=1080232 RepID=UPI00254181EE|nr:uncharacterized protein N7459_004672 [Penicillium hispanicum]KAJ5584872.1 hypothetical protein N7459_004672 [Penicillium hispanicum]
MDVKRVQNVLADGLVLLEKGCLRGVSSRQEGLDGLLTVKRVASGSHSPHKAGDQGALRILVAGDGQVLGQMGEASLAVASFIDGLELGARTNTTCGHVGNILGSDVFPDTLPLHSVVGGRVGLGKGSRDVSRGSRNGAGGSRSHVGAGRSGGSRCGERSDERRSDQRRSGQRRSGQRRSGQRRSDGRRSDGELCRFHGRSGSTQFRRIDNVGASTSRVRTQALWKRHSIAAELVNELFIERSTELVGELVVNLVADLAVELLAKLEVWLAPVDAGEIVDSGEVGVMLESKKSRINHRRSDNGIDIRRNRHGGSERMSRLRDGGGKSQVLTTDSGAGIGRDVTNKIGVDKGINRKIISVVLKKVGKWVEISIGDVGIDLASRLILVDKGINRKIISGLLKNVVKRVDISIGDVGIDLSSRLIQVHRFIKGASILKIEA